MSPSVQIVFTRYFRPGGDDDDSRHRDSRESLTTARNTLFRYPQIFRRSYYYTSRRHRLFFRDAIRPNRLPYTGANEPKIDAKLPRASVLDATDGFLQRENGAPTCVRAPSACAVLLTYVCEHAGTKITGWNSSGRVKFSFRVIYPTIRRRRLRILSRPTWPVEMSFRISLVS